MIKLISLALFVGLTAFPVRPDSAKIIGISFAVCEEEQIALSFIGYDTNSDSLVDRIEWFLAADDTQIGVTLQDAIKEVVTDLFILQPNGSIKHHAPVISENIHREYSNGWCTAAKRIINKRSEI